MKKGNPFIQENSNLKHQINFLIRDANKEKSSMQRKINVLLEKNVKLQKEVAYYKKNKKGARK